MTALICGSYAFDHIMVFPDRFKNHILPDKIHMLNVSFLVPDMRREFGGCAGNIAYTLNLLGGDVTPMATIGSDFAPYAAWMDKCGITREYVTEIETSYTGQAFITTDQDDNQITAFHPGAMSDSHNNKVTDAKGVSIGIVSPDGRDGMIEHARQFKEAGIPFIFDPGQGMPMFGEDDLKLFLEQATWLTVNDYEMQMFLDKTGMSPAEVAAQVEALIITRGGEGAEIVTKDKNIMIPVVIAKEIKDPTGCGDAFRSGLLYGLMNDLDWEITGRIASLLGSIKIEQHGTQNHNFTMDEFKTRFQSEFNMNF
ncbi:carbohydrate kinase family protein [sulfur-oxidizing endosymbiont of Gigantopelta aegis]|uniref:carbohydrate kinase family protein n=1 Tax=sulfur-oxidizing endosymbiont of Gigantopelta aegis TaxID=2794934 RepID=UPI0018DBC63C|nr:carbohydrate kinase family protein [sulfur-oxidizing endosymbiont of Gigantopelta aegis]